MRNILEFTNKFQTEQDCIDYLKIMKGTDCPHCGHEKTYEYKSGKLFKCASCRKQFTLKVGTIFEKSRLSLKTWFIAIFLMNASKKGISSVELGEKLGVRQATAWFMYHRIREMHKQPETIFQGTVEADETFVGGKEKNKHSYQRKGALPKKAVVMGIHNRDTKQVIAKHLPNTKAVTLKRYLYDNVETGSTLYTDDNLAYRHTRHIYKHESTKHGQGEYVKDKIIHSNTIESFWSIFKRGYIGVYHYMSKKHLQKYINEYTFRYNNKNVDIFFESMKNINSRLTYKELINE